MDKVITFSFCESFIEKLADYIKTEYVDRGQDLTRLAVVFGGKRPSLFLKRALAQRIGGNFYPPKFITIDQFTADIIHQQETFTATKDLDSCYLIYRIVQNHAPHLQKNRETFAKFLPWSRELLRFIDQIDLENIGDKQLTNIEEIAKIGFPIPDEINELLVHIVKLRHVYHQHMRDQKIYSRGYQYLRASELVGEVHFDDYDQILFCNFFYFNRSEERVMEQLYQRGLATFIFQGDQRRWPILNRLSKNHGWSIREGEQVDQPQFDLKLYAGFDAHSQIGTVRQIVSQIKDLENAVIVLANPDNIVPLLSSITDKVKNFNISMGYPLRRSSLYTLFDLIFRAQLSRKDERYYARDYLKVLLHPFVKNLVLSAGNSRTRSLVYKIEEILKGKERTSISGSIFVHLDEICQLDDLYKLVIELCQAEDPDVSRSELEADLEYLHHLLFGQWECINSFADFSEALHYFLTELIEKSFLKNYPLNLNIAHKIFEIHDELKHATFASEDFPKEEIFKVFDRKIASEIVAFIGSPLNGLQLLGLFETRSLNFDHVIVLDVNEGILPNLDIYEPLIPRDVMISLGMNRIELDEEIQRYQFMRLISSAKNVHLVYQQSKEKERSRFVEELVWEQQKKAERLEGINVIPSRFNVQSNPDVAEVVKTPEMIEMLRQHTFSASGINTYLRNPIDFYYHYILGLREQEDLLDEPEAREIGVFIHHYLDELFRPFVNRKPEIDAAFLDKAGDLFDQRFKEMFSRSMKSDSFLLRSVVRERMQRFIENEQKSPDRRVEKVLYLEQRFEDMISLACGDIRFSYIVDRIDQMEDGTLMILDYKTGSINPIPKNLALIEQMDLNRTSILENIKSFQIPLYYHYMCREFPEDRVNAAVYNLRTLKVECFIDPAQHQDRDRINQIFLNALEMVIGEILDPDVNFVDQNALLGI